MAKKHKKRIRRRAKSELQRIVEYMISGGVWFWSGYTIIVVFDGIIGLFLANLIGNAVGITLNFILERYWVFKTSRPTTLFLATQRYIIYTSLNAFLLNYLILLYFREIWAIGPEISQFIAAGFFTVWNYIWYKAWVFKGLETKPRRTRHHA